MTSRVGRAERATKETQVSVELDLDGTGTAEVSTGVPFFDHMLHQLAKHGRMDLRVKAAGDIEIDAHHTVEDTAITLGEALRQALGDKAGICRFGDALVPLDETLVRAAVDLAGRPYVVHMAVLSGRNPHHIVEAQFKAFARALRAAAAPDPGGSGIPSTKGVL